MNYKRPALLIGFVLGLSLHSLTSAAQYIGAQDIAKHSSTFIESLLEPITAKNLRSNYKIGKISPTLKFRQCSNTLDTSLRRDIFKTANNTLDIRCASPSWQLFVPVEIELYESVVTASTSIPKNSIIRERHLSLKEQQINVSRYGTYNSIDLVLGMVAKRTIRQGATITPSKIQPPMLISRGDQVLISAKGALIAIQMKGEALSSGVLGEQIRVKNLSSNRVIRAHVVDKGRVEVLL